MDASRKRLLKIFQVILVYAAVTLGASEGILWMHYYDTRPRSPDPIAGRTIALNTHGIAVYVTSGEHFRLRALMLATGTCFITAVLIEIIKTRGGFLQPKR
ncbi:MAG: hypothetical protein DMG37_12005 [Acidobacteria bacterium]|nr:MAG: hypothetical protein DMG37_12005 [Acidobacteriota bacterium]